MDEYVEIIKKAIAAEPLFPETLNIARGNSTGGKIWMVGSFLYKNIIKEIYGFSGSSVKDHDFVLQHQRDYSDPWAPEGWDVKKTILGGPRFVRDGVEVDVYSVSEACRKILSCDKSEKNPTKLIKTYIKHPPFDVQSMAYDLEEEKLYDEGAISAIEKRELRVVNLERCLGMAQKKHMCINEYLYHKAGAFGLKPIYPVIKT